MASNVDETESFETSILQTNSEDNLQRSVIQKSFTITEKRLVTRVYKHFIEKVSNERIKLENPLDVLKSLWHIVDKLGHLSNNDKKKVIILLIEDVAAGKDGILDTDDDIIPSNIVKLMIMMIECDMITSTIDLICEVTQIKTSVTMSMYVFQLLSYFCFCKCCRSRKPKVFRTFPLQAENLSFSTPFLSQQQT